MLRGLNAALSARCTASRAAAAAAAVLLTLAACGGAESRRISYIQRGREYFARGDFVKAGVEFRNAVQIAPRDPEARLLAGQAAEKLARWRDAAGLYQSVTELAPENVEARADLGRLYDLGGAPEQALKLVEPALAKHPDNASLLVVRALARARLKQTEAALADAERAVRLAPDNEDAVGLLAAMYRDRGEADRAVELVSSTLRRLPSSTDLREVLAAIYEGTGKPDQAIEQLQQLIKLKPARVAYRSQLAGLYAREHRYDDAQRTLEDEVRALPDSNEAKLALVAFAEAERSRAAAQKMLETYIAADPGNDELRLELGALLLRAGSREQSLAAYDAVLKRSDSGPDALIARDRIAAILLSEGKRADAEKMIGTVLSENPHDDDALRMRGAIELARGDSAAAIADFRAVLRDEPAAVPVRRMLASALLANQQPSLAEDELHTALEIAPDDTGARSDLAQLYEQTHRAEQAVALLEEGVHSRPADAALREALIRAYLAKGDLAAARTAAEDLKTLQPKSVDGYFLAAQVAEAQKRFDDAGQQLKRALELEPDAPAPLIALTRLELERGKSSEALARLQAAAARHPADAAVLEALGEAYLATRDFAHAADALSGAAKAAPSWWYPYHNLAAARQAQHDDAGAIEALQTGIKVAPAEPQIAMQLAVLYESKGRVDDAIATCEALYRRNPQPKVAASLAELLATYRTDQASLDRARDLSAAFASSSDPALLDTDGWVLYKRGEVQKALPVLERAVARAPGSRLIHYHLALAQLRAGERERARANLESALAGSASFPGASEARTVLARLTGASG
jgi:tetratricopeptide (TPR) repeat protein